MMRSMFAGVVGLQVHQIRMDVIGNNIANVNTPGFKASRATFYDLLSQTLRSASRPQGNRGGTNPMQVGLGVGLASIVPSMTTGAPQITGRNTDMAITGDGFFVLQGSTGGDVYTRDGTFIVDSEGYLTNAQGLRVLGWVADANGVISTNKPLAPVQVRGSGRLPARATTMMILAGGLDRNAAQSTVVSKQVTVYDADGTAYNVTIQFTKTQDGTATQDEIWDYKILGPSGTTVTGGTGQLRFDDATGALKSGSPVSFTLTPSGKTPMTINVDLSAVNLPLDATGKASGSPVTTELQVSGGLAVGTTTSVSLPAGGTPVVNTSTGTYQMGDLKINFTPNTQDPNVYSFQITSSDNNVSLANNTGTVRFDPGTGAVLEVTGGPLQVTHSSGAVTTIALNFAGLQPRDIRLTRQDGHPEQQVAGLISPRATSRVKFEKNINPLDNAFSIEAVVYDHLGDAHNLTIAFTKTGSVWSYKITGPTGLGLTNDTGYIKFTADGSYDAGGSSVPDLTITPPGGKPVTIKLDFSSVTQVGGQTDIAQSDNLPTSEKGYPAGTFEGFSVDSSGTITGHYSNGLSQPLAQVALALFSNPSALESRGGYWVESNNSGSPRLGPPGVGGRGTVQPGALEMSNVDLATEFTNMITTQRGYQANSRLITTADELLQELVNLKR